MKINARMCILNTPPRIKLDLSKLVLALSVIDVYRVRAAQSLSDSLPRSLGTDAIYGCGSWSKGKTE